MSNYTIDELLLMIQEKAVDINKITDAKDIYSLLVQYTNEDKEHFISITLDVSRNVINTKVIHIGTLNQSLVHPREIFKPAIADNAAAIIIAHNHPSGIIEPSRADIIITERLVKAGKLLGIEILDHVILTKNGYYSFKDEERL